MRATEFLDLYLSYEKVLNKEPVFLKEFENYFGKFSTSEAECKWNGKAFKDLGGEEAVERIRDVKKAIAKLVEEEVVQEEFVQRVCQCFNLKVVCNMDNKLLPDDTFRALHTVDDSTPQVMIEMKSFAQEADLLRDTDQLTVYVLHLLGIYPKLSFIKIIITDGWTFYYGHLQRKSHSELEITMIEDPHTLYKYVLTHIQLFLNLEAPTMVC